MKIYLFRKFLNKKISFKINSHFNNYNFLKEIVVVIALSKDVMSKKYWWDDIDKSKIITIEKLKNDEVNTKSGGKGIAKFSFFDSFYSLPGLSVQPILPSQPVMSPQPVLSPQPVMSPQPVLSPQPVMSPQPFLSPQPVMSPQPFLSSQPIMPPQPILPQQQIIQQQIFQAKPVLSPQPVQPILSSQPVIQPKPVLPPQPVVLPQPVLSPQPVLPSPAIVENRPFAIQKPVLSHTGQIILENTVGGIEFDCSFLPSGHFRDSQFCDVYHACVHGFKRKTYTCPIVGKRTYFDERTQR